MPQLPLGVARRAVLQNVPRRPTASVSGPRRINTRATRLPPPNLPPISQRLKPMIPFLIYWSIITSLAVHLLQLRKRSEAESARAFAQESVLQTLLERFQTGEVVPDSEIRRELEMVGLRERTAASAGVARELAEYRKVSWREMLFPQRREISEQEAVDEWSEIVKEAEQHGVPPQTNSSSPSAVDAQRERAGVARRPTSTSVFL